MATYHLSARIGSKGKAGPHAMYIAREGKYTDGDRYEDLEATWAGGMPAWAKHAPARFWESSDALERKGGSSYREIEIALPRELTPAQRRELVEDFIRQELGGKHAYQVGVHIPKAAIDGGDQPHAHIMYSMRINDGLDRDPDQYFKRYNAKNPALGGCQKASGGKGRFEMREELKVTRERWANLQNEHLAKHGFDERVDHRSLKERGIERAPGRKMSLSDIDRLSPDDLDKIRELREAEKELEWAQNAIPADDIARAIKSGKTATPADLAKLEKGRTHGNEKRHIRKFEAWRDNPGDPPGLRASRALGPQRMPVMRDDGVFSKPSQQGDALLLDAVQGHRGLHHQMHGMGAGENAGERGRGISIISPQKSRWQEWREQVLTDQYSQDVAKRFAAADVYVKQLKDGLLIRTKDGIQVADYGERIVGEGEREVGMMIQIAKAKGWTHIGVNGTPEMRMMLAKAAVRNGMDVADRDLSKLAKKEIKVEDLAKQERLAKFEEAQREEKVFEKRFAMLLELPAEDRKRLGVATQTALHMHAAAVTQTEKKEFLAGLSGRARADVEQSIAAIEKRREALEALERGKEQTEVAKMKLSPGRGGRER